MSSEPAKPAETAAAGKDEVVTQDKDKTTQEPVQQTPVTTVTNAATVQTPATTVQAPTTQENASLEGAAAEGGAVEAPETNQETTTKPAIAKPATPTPKCVTPTPPVAGSEEVDTKKAVVDTTKTEQTPAAQENPPQEGTPAQGGVEATEANQGILNPVNGTTECESTPEPPAVNNVQGEEAEVAVTCDEQQMAPITDAEKQRLADDQARSANWKRWGPYLSERQWGTVREDYSPDGNCWEYLSHDASRSRAYRWGEDGLAGICDRQGRLCLSLALWNTRDKILKERLFGLTGPQGNHGEDVKELYYYLDSTPTHSYMQYLYKYPQQEYPYLQLEKVNKERTIHQPEYELEDTGVIEKGYWDVEVEYAKASPSNVLMEITIANRGTKADTVHVLPQLWYRNTWVWGCTHEGCGLKPRLTTEVSTRRCEVNGTKEGENEIAQECVAQESAKTDKPKTEKRPELLVKGTHETLGEYFWAVDQENQNAELLWTENETNTKKLFEVENYTPFVKDAFHRYIVEGETDAVNAAGRGTKVAAHYKLHLQPGESATIRTRLWQSDEPPQSVNESGENQMENTFGSSFKNIMDKRKAEANNYYDKVLSDKLSNEERIVARQALAGLLWSKQFYHYIVRDWLHGDANMPAPPEERLKGRNSDWSHLFNRDIISMPDKWEYPWYAVWDLAFHCVALALVDQDFAKEQLMLFLREWYMHPNGQIPAYEFALGDVNPPVHAWAVLYVYRGGSKRGQRDHTFLAKAFQKLTLNFTWWVNRKDPDGRHLFSGGFLGLDNIGVFDRSQPLPIEGKLEQADGTAWMAFFCTTMLDMALTLAEQDPVYEDMASKYFEHFIHIMDSMNSTGQGHGLWDEDDGFYYDYIRCEDGTSIPIKARSLVGLTPLFACLVLEKHDLEKLPGFYKRTKWFIANRPDLTAKIAFMKEDDSDKMLLAVPTKAQLISLMRYLLDENEFLSKHGIRSLSKVHKDHPFVMDINGQKHEVGYVPGESNTHLFGGNSNWRGPIWVPMNFLIITSLKRYHYFYGDSLKVECPTGSENFMNLEEVATFLAKRLISLFTPHPDGSRPCHGTRPQYCDDPHWKNLVLFYEYFHGDTGRGCGAPHQTGWSALVANCLNITLGYSHAGLGRHDEEE